jgi:hypothetical protein
MLSIVLILVVSMFVLSVLAVTTCMLSARISVRDDASGYEAPLLSDVARLAPATSQTTRLSVSK